MSDAGYANDALVRWRPAAGLSIGDSIDPPSALTTGNKKAKQIAASMRLLVASWSSSSPSIVRASRLVLGLPSAALRCLRGLGLVRIVRLLKY
jgi:hypothetical protein